MRNLKRILIFVFSVQILFSISTEKLEEAKNLLKKGFESWEISSLERAREEFIKLSLSEKNENPFLLYYISLADYRISTYFISTQSKDKAERFLEEGISYIKKSFQVDSKFYEAYALYASLLGLKINIKPEEAMFLGMESEKYFSIALEKGGDNPRVNLLKGISTLYTPEMFGGGAKNALKFIEKAISLFEKEKIGDPILPSWGKDEAYTYLGIVYEKLGEREKAIQALKKALEINPQFGYAKINLERIEKGVK